MLNNPLSQPAEPLQQAILKLKAYGYAVEREQFPPAPLPGLYRISGGGFHDSEMTENQVISMAENV